VGVVAVRVCQSVPPSSSLTHSGARRLAEKYKSLRADYVGPPYVEEFDVDNELQTVQFLKSPIIIIIIYYYTC